MRQPQFPIEKQVFEGQALMVQVIKDPIGTKGARLSTQISIAGRMLVFLPQDDHIGVSQKIPQDQRDELRTRLQQLAGRQQGGGFILRTNGEDAIDAELARRHRLFAQGLGAHQGCLDAAAADVAVAPGLESVAAGVAGPGGREHPDHQGRFAGAV